MFDFPNTRHKMLRAGYTSLFKRTCSRCRQPIERFRTRNGKEITMDAAEKDTAIVKPHAQTCTGTAAGKRPTERIAADLHSFLQARSGIAIVMVDSAGSRHWIVSNDAAPDETKDNLVGAAFEIKQHLEQREGEKG